jgi:hypothetical protein
MGEAGRRRVTERFTPECRALVVEETYTRALAERLP